MLSSEYIRSFEQVPLAALVELHNAQRECELDSYVGQAWKNANEAFRDADNFSRFKPLALISSIASSQESPATIGTTLSEFEAQRLQGAPALSICVGCNGPDWDGVQAVMETVHDFQQEHPALPLTFFGVEYPPGTIIGRKKKDAANVFLQVLALILPTHGQFPEPTALVFEDMDLVKWSRGYLTRMCGALASGAALAQARVHHARSSGRFPNMDRVMFWYDLPIQFGPYWYARYTQCHVFAALCFVRRYCRYCH